MSGIEWDGNTINEIYKRQIKRISGHFYSRLHDLKTNMHDIVVVKNISSTGALFYYWRELAVGSEIKLNVNISQTEAQIECFGVVVRSNHKPNGSLYRTAVRFTAISSADNS